MRVGLEMLGTLTEAACSIAAAGTVAGSFVCIANFLAAGGGHDIFSSIPVLIARMRELAQMLRSMPATVGPIPTAWPSES